MVDLLLDDRALAARRLGLRRAQRARVRRALAGATGDVRRGAAGVASLYSAVDTLPTRMPRSRAISNVVLKPLFEPGTVSASLGPWLRRASIVFLPVDHAVAVGAESGT